MEHPREPGQRDGVQQREPELATSAGAVPRAPQGEALRVKDQRAPAHAHAARGGPQLTHTRRARLAAVLRSQGDSPALGAAWQRAQPR